MRKIQALIVPVKVNELLKLGEGKPIKPILTLYKISRKLKLNKPLRNLILPAAYKAQILSLETF
jgi:hypothetical protein